MSVVIEVPGGTCELRDASEMRGRDRKLVGAAALAAASAIAKLPPDMDAETPLDAASLAFTLDEAMAMGTLREVVAIARLVSWTLDRPLPTAQTIGDLPGDLYDALIEQAGDPSVAAETDFTAAKRDGESPTSGSSGSAGPSTAAAPSPSTPRRRPAGASTATASSTPA